MTLTINKNPAFWLLAIFLILLGLSYFGVAIPAIVLGLLAFVSGVFMVIATG